MRSAASKIDPDTPQDFAKSAQLAGINEFARKRKEDSRAKLLAAGLSMICKRGYMAVKIEDIATTAGVSRLTFYRHFGSKGELAAELYKQMTKAAMPRMIKIREQNFRDRDVVVAWLQSLFEADRDHRHLQRAFAIIAAEEPALAQPARETVQNLISGLGEKIPAFLFEEGVNERHRRWLEAWLLLFEILFQGRQASLDHGVANDPVVIEILADRFLAFVGVSTCCCGRTRSRASAKIAD